MHLIPVASDVYMCGCILILSICVYLFLFFLFLFATVKVNKVVQLFNEARAACARTSLFRRFTDTDGSVETLKTRHKISAYIYTDIFLQRIGFSNRRHRRRVGGGVLLRDVITVGRRANAVY